MTAPWHRGGRSRGPLILLLAAVLLHAVRGVTELQKSQFQRGINDLRRKIAANTSCDVDAYMSLGNKFAQLQGRAHDAAESYLAAMRCNPRAGLPPYNLGALLSRAGEDQLALAQLYRSLNLEPAGQWSHLSWQGVGIIRTRQGRTREAVQAYRQALRLAPHDSGSHISLAQVLRGARRPAEALRFAEAAVRLQPHDQEGVLEVGRCLLDLGRIRDAIAVWEAGIRAGMDLGSFLDVARARKAPQPVPRLVAYIGRPPQSSPEGPEEEESEACRFGIEASPKHLPRSLVGQGMPCKGHRAGRRLAAALHGVQYPVRCRPLESAVYEMPLYGFGSVVNYAVAALAFSFHRGVTFVPAAWFVPLYNPHFVYDAS